MHERFYKGKFILETIEADVLNDNDTRNKNSWCLALEKVVALKRASCNRNGSYCWLTRSACVLSVAQLSGNVWPRWHSQHTAARHYAFCRSFTCSWTTQWVDCVMLHLLRMLVDQILLQMLGALQMSNSASVNHNNRIYSVLALQYRNNYISAIFCTY